MAHKKDLIITIDGPSGAGKSTIAKILSQKLGYTFIDTGAMYRGIAYAYKIRANNETIDKMLESLSIRFEFGAETKVFIDGTDISKKIRDPEISILASSLSQQQIVREYLYKVQREMGKWGGVVLEGRDTGSVVFPDAQCKFYLDADSEERAKRRHIELRAKGKTEALAKVKEEMIQRDKNDSERDIAPLVIPEDAIYVDTTGIDTAGVLQIILKYVATKETK